MIDRIPTSAGATGVPGMDVRPPANKAEAARQFEEILVKQLVQTMTENLFKATMGGDDTPQWMGSYADAQRDVLNDALADHLIDSGTIRLSDLMLRQWNALEKPTEPENEQ